MSDADQLEGTARNVTGKIQDVVGNLTGDLGTQVRGKINQAAGAAQSTFAAAADEARELTNPLGEVVQNRPLAALLTVGALGFALGLLARR